MGRCRPRFPSTLEHAIQKIPDNFNYKIPSSSEIGEYRNFIDTFPDVDSPEVLGLHPNADLTFRFQEVTVLLDTILETQPKQTGAVEGGAYA